MDDKNINRRNEALKDVAEAQKEIADFNRDIDFDIHKINYALWYGNHTQREECWREITRKHPDYAHYLDNRAFVLNLLCNDPTTLLGIQKQALINKKCNHSFQEYIERGAKLQVKWRLEDVQDW